MKNKLLVSVFAMAVAAFGLSSCETESNVTEVCTDMIQESMHKSARSLAQLDGQTLTISEYEFLGGVNDDRMVYRTIAFGNGVKGVKTVDTLTYAYGEWGEHNTSFSLLITPPMGDPYTLWYKGNVFLAPDGRVYGGDGTANSSRVEKWEKTIATLPNTAWDATFEDEFVQDSVFEDSIRTIFIPPMTFKTDTIKVFKGQMDTLSADTTCIYRVKFERNPQTFANTGHFYMESIRSTYDRATKETTIVSRNIKEYDFEWYFSEVSSDAKFVIVLKSTTPGVDGQTLSISKYKADDQGGLEFLLDGVTYSRAPLDNH